MAWALAQQDVSDPTARHVLLCLANYANERGMGAFPAVSTLCRDTGLSERTVQAKLAFLTDSGVIRRGNQAIAAAYVDRADRRPTVYDLDLSRGAAGAPGQAHGVQLGANGVQLTTERGAGAAPDPSSIRKLPLYGAAAIVLRKRGLRVTSQDPRLIAAVDAGVTPDHLDEVAATYPDKPAAYVIAAALGQLTENPATPAQGPRRATGEPRTSVVERAQQRTAELLHAAEARDAALVEAAG